MKDPVCGMNCDPETSDTMEYKGQTYCFCSSDCREQFEKSPERFIHAQTGGTRGTGGMGQGGTQSGGRH